MSCEGWLVAVRDAKKRCVLCNGMKKVYYNFMDGKEMFEEYNMQTGMVVRRAWMSAPNFAGETKWEIEVGEPDFYADRDMEHVGLAESPVAPMVTKRITKIALEWRIRNLPYPVHMYDVIADPDEYCMIVKTRNKKYYKKIMIPDLKRIGVKPEQDKIEFTHQFNTLIITYDKPAELILTEKLVFEEINQVKAMENDMECKQS